MSDAGSDAVERFDLGSCRHCGHTIARLQDRGWAHLTLSRRGDGVPGSARHSFGAHFLNRCQSDVPRYGYDAMPDTGGPCECVMCSLHGEASASELDALRRWKAEALAVLDEWEAVWVVAGRPGRLGASKARSVGELLERRRLARRRGRLH